MSDIRKEFPSKYLKAPDLGTNRPRVRIQKVVMEDVGDDHKPVVYFVGKEKALVLNKTNANMIEEITGSFETDDWRGKTIQLYATKTEMSGKRVDCIRIEWPTVDVAAPAPVGATPLPASFVPFAQTAATFRVDPPAEAPDPFNTIVRPDDEDIPF